MISLLYHFYTEALMKKEGYYRIGKVSRITGISKDTLHFYNKIGLLVPDYIDEENQYRYYSRWNLWQLDIISMCRKLSIPLEKVKQLLNLHDNGKITDLLLDYQSEALRLSEYYRQVASDISWYQQEHMRIASQKDHQEIQQKYRKAEQVITGDVKKDGISYHARLQSAAKEALRESQTIQRKYGYILGLPQIFQGEIYKTAEYLKLPGENYQHVAPEHLYTLPEGEYAVCILRIVKDRADFNPLLDWMKEHHYRTDAVFAEELGLQLFDYIDDYYCEVRAHLLPE